MKKLRAEETSGILSDLGDAGQCLCCWAASSSQRHKDEPQQQVVPREVLALKCPYSNHQYFPKACHSPSFPLFPLPFACFQPSGLVRRQGWVKQGSAWLRAPLCLASRTAGRPEEQVPCLLRTHTEMHKPRPCTQTHISALLHLDLVMTISHPQRAMGSLTQASTLPVAQAKNSAALWAPPLLTPRQQVLSILPSKYIWDWKLFISCLDSCSSHLAGLPASALTHVCSLRSSRGDDAPLHVPPHSESKSQVWLWPPKLFLTFSAQCRPPYHPGTLLSQGLCTGCPLGQEHFL